MRWVSSSWRELHTTSSGISFFRHDENALSTQSVFAFALNPKLNGMLSHLVAPGKGEILSCQAGEFFRTACAVLSKQLLVDGCAFRRNGSKLLGYVVLRNAMPPKRFEARSVACCDGSVGLDVPKRLHCVMPQAHIELHVGSIDEDLQPLIVHVLQTDLFACTSRVNVEGLLRHKTVTFPAQHEALKRTRTSRALLT